ncbi:DUF4032 domain-containing protein [Demequina oxidasica]|uniref:DUF4032 domain-containing protein n=1 Tax=Demequina oxidasica TaxID=676199 RepID=UPI000A05A35E|nr:DUF4032 domain-containing protein [Demequina oxidasica]
MPLHINGAGHPEFMTLPWSLPLEQWPTDQIAALPRGISRHVVRFVKLADKVVAIKETNATIAEREFVMLRELQRLGAPGVVPLAVVSGRTNALGEPLEAALITEHLQFSLPYRSLFSQALREETTTRFVDALAVLLVRLHLLGFYWGDVSLSNALFRRDAAEFTAYLVDAETGDLHAALSEGQRSYDTEIARMNIIGELMDLEAQGHLEDTVDPMAIADRLQERYDELWEALTQTATYTSNIPLRIANRVKELNELGFDVSEMDMRETDDGEALVMRAKVVDAGHHARRLMRLTGLDVQENQARRLLNDLDEYRMLVSHPSEDEGYSAHQWLMKVFEPTVRAVPREFRKKLEPAQVFHEVLDHRWFLAEAADHDVAMPVAVASYVKNVLPNRPDEQSVLGTPASELNAAEMTADLPALTAEVEARSQETPIFEGDNTGAWGGAIDDEDSAADADDAPSSAPTVTRQSTKREPPAHKVPGSERD